MYIMYPPENIVGILVRCNLAATAHHERRDAATEKVSRKRETRGVPKGRELNKTCFLIW
ncbi:MAG: hypothetical protein ACJATN_000333 [Neolewinella sp.]|jgi:hypothetical protein